MCFCESDVAQNNADTMPPTKADEIVNCKMSLDDKSISKLFDKRCLGDNITMQATSDMLSVTCYIATIPSIQSLLVMAMLLMNLCWTDTAIWV